MRVVVFEGAAATAVGRDFGVITDIETAPSGKLFVISPDQGAIYEISRRWNGASGGS